MKFKFNLLALIALLIIVSCNNDDSPKSPAEAVQGNYEGISVAEHKYSDKPQTTKREKNENFSCASSCSYCIHPESK